MLASRIISHTHTDRHNTATLTGANLMYYITHTQTHRHKHTHTQTTHTHTRDREKNRQSQGEQALGKSPGRTLECQISDQTVSDLGFKGFGFKVSGSRCRAFRRVTRYTRVCGWYKNNQIIAIHYNSNTWDMRPSVDVVVCVRARWRVVVRVGTGSVLQMHAHRYRCLGTPKAYQELSVERPHKQRADAHAHAHTPACTPRQIPCTSVQGLGFRV